MSFMLLGILNAQAAGGGGGAFELLGTAEPNGVSDVTFTGIDSNYRHLQIRFAVALSMGRPLYLEVNSDTSASYSNHTLVGTGGLVVSGSNLNTNYVELQSTGTTFTDWFSTGVVDVLDFSSSSKNTTFKTLSVNNFNQIHLLSGLWNDTSSVTSINFRVPSATYISGTRFSLYGVK